MLFGKRAVLHRLVDSLANRQAVPQGVEQTVFVCIEAPVPHRFASAVDRQMNRLRLQAPVSTDRAVLVTLGYGIAGAIVAAGVLYKVLKRKRNSGNTPLIAVPPVDPFHHKFVWIKYLENVDDYGWLYLVASIPL